MASGMEFVLTAYDKSVGKTLDGIGDKLDKTGKRSHGFGKGLAKAGAMAAVGLAAGATAAVAFGVKAVSAAMDDQQAARILATTLRANTGARKADIASIEDWISKTTLATGVADDDLRPALGNLVRATKDTTKAQGLLKTAMNVSAATGKPLQTISIALSKAYNGSTDSLGRLGINMKDAKGKALPFKDALKRLNEQFGGAQQAKTKSFAGQVQVLKNRFNETVETIGYKLLPIASKLMGWINSTAIPAIGKFADWFQVHLMPALRNIWDTIRNKVIPAVVHAAKVFAEKMAPHIQKVKDALVDAKPSIDAVLRVLKAVAKFVIEKLLPIFGKWVTFLLGHVLDAIAALIRFWGNLIRVIGAVYTKIRDFIGRVRDRWNGLVDFVKKLPGRITSAASGMWDGIKNAFKSMINTIIGWWNALDLSIPSVHIPGTNITLGGVGDIIPDIPTLGRGGIVSRPTLALVGESGPEAVVPLSRRGGLGDITVYVDLRGAIGVDDRKTATAVRRALQGDRNRGVALGIA